MSQAVFKVSGSMPRWMHKRQTRQIPAIWIQAQPFVVPIVSAGSTNLDPALATTVGKTYCYDLPFANGSKTNYVLVNLVDANTIKVNYGYTASAASGSSAATGCSALGALPYALPNGPAWKTYSR